MILIADCGSTKTDWCVTENKKVVRQVFTCGMNAVMLTEEEMRARIAGELVPEIGDLKDKIEAVYFYGAGCIAPDVCANVANAIRENIPAPVIEVHTDLLAAARALCGHKPGIACIMGTGSNSCYYDGKQIVKNVRSLGFVLGDEGSASYIGKRFVSDCLKDIAPEQLRNSFYEYINKTPDEIMTSIYENTLPGNMLSVYSRFLMDKLEMDYVYDIVYSSINDFFTRNVAQYNYRDLNVCFVGSNACAYSGVLNEVAKKFGINIRKILPSSVPGLVHYHATND